MSGAFDVSETPRTCVTAIPEKLIIDRPTPHNIMRTTWHLSQRNSGARMTKTAALVAITLLAFLAGVKLSAQVKAAWPWPDSLEALAAAPEFHTALFENDHIRLLEVTVNPGVSEKIHTHRYPSALVMDAPVPTRSELTAAD